MAKRKNKTAGRFQWEDGFDRVFLLTEFANCRTTNDGKSGFKGADYSFWKPVLKSAIRANAEVGHLKSTCIEQALADASLSLNDPDKFIARCDTIFEEIKKKKSKFVALFFITYNGPALFTRIDDGDCKIRWQPSPSNRAFKRMLAERTNLKSLFDNYKVSTSTVGMTALLVEVEALSATVAYELAADAIDRLRGVLNLIINRKRTISLLGSFTSRPHAINRIRLGPCGTVHVPDGSLATKIIWYETRWVHDLPTITFSGSAKKTREGIRKHWKMSQDNPLRVHITDGLLRYCRALDQHDAEACLLGLWGVLEALTGTMREKYDLTVSRLIPLWTDTVEAKQIAMHIKTRRNATVHASQTLERRDVDMIMTQAEMLAAQLLSFYIVNEQRFKDQDEVKRFLDLPLDDLALASQLKRIKSFTKYKSRK